MFAAAGTNTLTRGKMEAGLTCDGDMLTNFSNKEDVAIAAFDVHLGVTDLHTERHGDKYKNYRVSVERSGVNCKVSKRSKQSMEHGDVIKLTGVRRQSRPLELVYVKDQGSIRLCAHDHVVMVMHARHDSPQLCALPVPQKASAPSGQSSTPPRVRAGSPSTPVSRKEEVRSSSPKHGAAMDISGCASPAKRPRRESESAGAASADQTPTPANRESAPPASTIRSGPLFGPTTAVVCYSRFNQGPAAKVVTSKSIELHQAHPDSIMRVYISKTGVELGSLQARLPAEHRENVVCARGQNPLFDELCTLYKGGVRTLHLVYDSSKPELFQRVHEYNGPGTGGWADNRVQYHFDAIHLHGCAC